MACSCSNATCETDDPNLSALAKTFSVRLTKADVQRLTQYCSKNACSQSQLMRLALAQFVDAGTPANDKILEEIRKLFGMPDASATDLAAAVASLDSSDSAPAPALGLTRRAPAKAPAQTAKLTAQELATLKAKGWTPEQFAARKRAAVKSR